MADQLPWWKRWFTHKAEPQKSEAPPMDKFLVDSEWKKELERYHVAEAHLRLYNKVATKFTGLGETKGRLGQPRDTKEAADLAQRVARDFLLLLRTWYQGKLSELNGKLDAARKAEAKREAQFNYAAQWQVDVEKEYRDDTTKHSRFNAWMYLCFGLALIAADIPFSWELTAEGFGFKPGRDSDGFPNFDSILTAIVSFGIASTAVYIKYYFDSMIAPNLKNAISLLRTGAPHDIGPMTNWRWRKIEFVWFFRFLVETALLVFVVYTLWHTGSYRFETLHVRDTVASVESKLEKKQAELNYYEITGKIEPDSLQSDIAKLVNRKENLEGSELVYGQLDTNKRTIFILLTLAFPVMGGVLLSISIRMLRARADRKESVLRYDKMEQYYAEKRAEVVRLEQEKQTLEKFVDEHFKLDPTMIDHVAAAFLQQFNMAYNTAIWQTINGPGVPPVVVTTTRTITLTPQSPPYEDPPNKSTAAD
jgi:hypothetical protein